MKKLIWTICIVVLFVTGNVGNVFAEDEISVEVVTDFYSKYIWRGIQLNDDPVFQPSINLGWKNFTATIWGDIDLTGYNGRNGDLYELDYVLDYSNAVPGLEGVGYSIGAAYFSFPGTGIPDTTEIYWGFNFDCPLNPSVTFSHDVDEAEGTYISFAVGHSIEKIAELSPDMPIGMEISSSLGWGSSAYDNYYWGTNQSELNDLTLGVSFPVEICNGWTLTPSLNYATLVSGNIRSTDAYGDNHNFFVGVSLCKKFK